MNVKYTPEPLKICNDSIVFKRMFSGQNILQLEILRYINILRVIENCIRGGITNNKYMSGYDKSNKSSYVKYNDVNNQYDALYYKNVLKIGMNM